MKRRTRLCRAVLLALVLLFCAGGVLGVLSVREERLNGLQAAALTKLQECEGQYRDEVLILEDTNRKRAEELAARFDAQLDLIDEGSIAILTLPQGQNIAQIFSEKENRSILQELTPDYIYTADGHEAEDANTNPPAFPSYPVKDALFYQQLNLPYIHLGETWNITKGKNQEGERVLVAVIDTGIDTDHPDFVNAAGEKIMSPLSYNTVTNKVVKNDGWSAVEDDYGHGTWASGVIAAQMNSIGVTGIAPDVEIMVIKANIAQTKNFYRSDILEGIDYAVKNGAQVLSMSFGGPGAYNTDYFANIVAKGVIPVASAGNDATNTLAYPAADANVIGVGALAYNSWALASYSNYGDNSDLVAPGTSVYTTAIGGGYTRVSGTSFSCPTVAAAVALYIAQHGVTPYADLRRALLSSCTDIGDPGEDTYFGHGALDIAAFLDVELVDVHLDYRTDGVENITLRASKGGRIFSAPPEIPQQDGLTLEGWYLDPRLTQRIDLATYTFNAEATLYARWLGASEGDFDYATISAGSVEILAYRGDLTALKIPDKINNKRVVSIGDAAFMGNTALQSITLPKDVTLAGDRAFAGCNALQTVCVNSTILVDKIAVQGSFGGLFENAATVLVPASLKGIDDGITALYPHSEELQIGESAYLKLSDHETQWEQLAVLTPHIACRQDGILSLQCTGCSLTKEKILPMHTVSDWVTALEPGCESTGSKVKECTLCHVTLETQSLPALGHVQVKSPAIPAGCETEGYTPQQCSRCGLQTRIYVVPPTGHTQGEWVTVLHPTKTEQGSKQRSCTVCDKVLEAEALAAYTHLLDFEADVAALSGKATKAEYDAIVACITYYNALTDPQKAAVAQDYALLGERIAAYNTDAKARSNELSDTTKAAANVLGQVQDALGALWYAFQQNRTKGA